MRESMARLTPRFCATRTVREYTENHYIPAALAYKQRNADNGEFSRCSVDWQGKLKQQWASLRIGEVAVKTEGANHLFDVQVYLNQIELNFVRVELYADGIHNGKPVCQELVRGRQLDSIPYAWIYSGSVPAVRSSGDYTARILPKYSGMAFPLEDAHILWKQ
jgi:starch phosphorylase